MLEYFSNMAKIEWVLLSIAAIGVVVLFIGLYLVRLSQLLKGDSLTHQLAAMAESHAASVAQIEAKLESNQQRLFDNLSQDRERQLNSIAALRLDLEQRFSLSSKVLSEDIQSFKLQMVEHFEKLKRATLQSMSEGHLTLTTHLNQFSKQSNEALMRFQSETQSQFDHKISQGLSLLNQNLDKSIKQQNEQLKQSLNFLTESTDKRLREISGQVEKRLTEGFEKTTQTFQDVLQRLALIDDAQKKITELSSNVMSLQEVLNDKRSRGAFGEVQLQSLISNTMPDSHYKMQYKLSNGKIADCMLELPEPSGRIAIDAKFPLESYRKMTDVQLSDIERASCRKQFSKDIKKHIFDISGKYILPPETGDGAVMFIPAESVFAEIHGSHPELVELAYQKKVWLVSPTTLMAILTTASSVIKDEQTRQQVHIIKQHLGALATDFGRFQTRMDNLAKHIGQVSKDVEQVHVSASKISSRFEKIEKVEVEQEVIVKSAALSLSAED
ncbi:DNA recombination protein RmuC [Aliikangiella sp. IMCC44653]